MIQFTRNLKENVDKNLLKIDSEEVAKLNKVSENVLVLRAAFSDLRRFINSYTFQDEIEEIYFFKEVKPRLFSDLIYYQKLYNLEVYRPTSGQEELKNYLKKELTRIKDYYERNKTFYRYFRSNETMQDRQFFLRGENDNLLYCHSVFYERDPQFSTVADLKLAKVLAHEKLEKHISEELMRMDCKENSNSEFFIPSPRLTWLASKSDLIELIYAFDSIQCFGNIALRQVADYFEQAFNIKLDSNLSRAFNDMKIRNNPTPCIDRLKTALIKRMQKWKRKDN